MKGILAKANRILAKALLFSQWNWIDNGSKSEVISTPEPVNVFDLPDYNPHPLWRNQPTRPKRFAIASWCFLSGEGVLFKGTQLIKELNIAFEDKLQRQWTPFFQIKCFEKKLSIHLNASVLVWDDWGSGNYYHWFCESLVRLNAFLDTGKEAVVLLPANPPNFVLDSLKHLFPSVQTKTMKANRLHLFRRLYIQDYLVLNVPHPSVLFIRERMLGVLSSQIGSVAEPTRLGILRKGSLRRRIINQEDYETWCVENGIRLIDPGEFSFIEQVRLFAQANFLIAPHGAGQTNMLFMRSGASIMEINKADTAAATMCYLSLSAQLGFRFYYLPAKVSGYDLAFDAATADRLMKNI